MTATLPPDWQRICGARFMRLTHEVPNLMRDLEANRLGVNDRDFYGIPAGRIGIGKMSVSIGSKWAYIDWYPEFVVPDADGRPSPVVVETPVLQVTLKRKMIDFADIFAGWELVGYLYREA